MTAGLHAILPHTLLAVNQNTCLCERHTERFDQMSTHRTSTETFANSLCRDLGHDWMTTATANYRVCKREKCRASQRLVDGQWESLARVYRFHDPVVEYRRQQRQPRQTTMWDSGY